MNIKPTKSANIKRIDENDNLISDPGTIGNIFNDHFSTLGATVQGKIPHAEGSYKDYLNKRSKNERGEIGKGKLLINPNGCSFFLTATGPDEIAKVIERLDSSKSSGPFGIPMFLIKAFKEFFSIWLSQFDKSLF